MDVPESFLEDVDKEKVRWFLRKAKSERGFDIDEDTSIKVYMLLKGAEDSTIVKYLYPVIEPFLHRPKILEIFGIFQKEAK